MHIENGRAPKNGCSPLWLIIFALMVAIVIASIATVQGIDALLVSKL